MTAFEKETAVITSRLSARHHPEELYYVPGGRAWVGCRDSDNHQAPGLTTQSVRRKGALGLTVRPFPSSLSRKGEKSPAATADHWIETAAGRY